MTRLDNRDPKRLDNRDPLIVREVLRTLNDRAGSPSSNRTYAENERGMELRGWNPCQGEPAGNGKRLRCENGYVRKGKFQHRCSRCRGLGGWHGDPYDEDQITIVQGPQKPSTFTVPDFAQLILTIDRRGFTQDGKYAIDHANEILEKRQTGADPDTTTHAENPAVTQLRIAVAKLADRKPRSHGLIRRVHIEQWTKEEDLDLIERSALRQAMTHLARLLPHNWCPPRSARDRAEAARDLQAA